MLDIVALDGEEKCSLLCDLWNRIGGHATSTSLEDVCTASVVIMGERPTASLGQLRPHLAGKILIDCSNPRDGHDLRTQVSRAEVLHNLFPNARVIKALNAISTEALTKITRHGGPEIGSVYPSAFFCGDDAEAKRVVAGLIEELNLDPVDCGPLSSAVLLEAVGLLENYLTSRVASTSVITLARRRPQRSPLDRWL